MNWIITIFLFDNEKKIYKVTRHFPPLSISETRFFSTKQKVQQQVTAWLV